MSKLNLKAFGVRDIGRNEVVLTNDQIHTLCFLVGSRLDYCVKKLKEAESRNNASPHTPEEAAAAEMELQIDLNALQWQVNNNAYLLSTLLPFENPKYVPDLNEKLTALSNLLKPLKQ